MSRALALLIMASIMVGLSPVLASSNVYVVPIDYPTIQSAINNVPPGSIIELNGMIFENRIRVWKDVTIRGGVLDYWRDYGFYVEGARNVVFEDMVIMGEDIWYTGYYPPTFPSTSAQVGIIVFGDRDTYVRIDNVTITTYGASKPGGAKITYLYGVAVRGFVKVDIINSLIENQDIGVDALDRETTIDPTCITEIDIKICDEIARNDVYRFKVNIINTYIEGDVGVAAWSLFNLDDNNELNIINSTIEGEIGVFIFSRESNLKYFMHATVSNSRIHNLDVGKKLNVKYDPGIRVATFKPTLINVEDTLIRGFDFGYRHTLVFISEFPREDIATDVDIVGTSILDANQGGIVFDDGFLKEGRYLAQSLDVLIQDSFIETISPSKFEAIQILYKAKTKKYVLDENGHVLRVKNTNASGYARGVSVDVYAFRFEALSIYAEKFFFNNPSGYGLYLNITSEGLFSFRPADIEASFSLLYGVFADMRVLRYLQEITLYETVYDEVSSRILDRRIFINATWTLETIVLSSLTGQPIPFVNTMYKWDAGSVTGATDNMGSYRYTFNYLYGPNYDYDWTYTFVDRIIDIVWTGQFMDSTTHPAYFLDSLTSPSWFRQIYFTFPLLAMTAIGFSHDMGTTYLAIFGGTGGFVGLYSYSPVDNPSHLPVEAYQGVVKGFAKYDLLIKKVRVGSVYTVIEAEIFYEGYWQPTVIIINKINGLVWSPGPVDFRGWLN